MPVLNNTNVHYVKFIRGSISAWERLLETPNKIDDDTLYFIYASGENTREGELYLGQKLISGVGEGGSSIININDIGDVFIDGESLENKQILVYNETINKWQNTSLSNIINTAVGEMTGATAAADGAAGLVPQPHAGQQANFLRGDGTWAPLNIPTFNDKVFSLNNNIISLQGYDLAAIGTIPLKTENEISWVSLPAGKLNRKITTLEKLQAQLNGTDPEPISEDTIYMVLNSDTDESNNKYDEYMIIENRLERLGTFGEVNLTNYVTLTTFNTKVGNIENTLFDQQDEQTGETIPGLISRVSYIETNFVRKADIGDLSQLQLSAGNSNLVEEINTMNSSITQIDERLKWKELQEE